MIQSNKTSKTKLLFSTILGSSLILSSANTASACSYQGADGSIISTKLQCDNSNGLLITESSDLIFEDIVYAFTNNSNGIYIENSNSIQFNSYVTTIDSNEIGIHIDNSSVVFKKDISIENSITDTGIDIDGGSQVTVDGRLTVNKTGDNGIEIQDLNTNAIFNGEVKVDTAAGNGIIVENSAQATFQDTVSVFSSGASNIAVKNNSKVSFNKNVNVENATKYALEVINSEVTFLNDFAAEDQKILVNNSKIRFNANVIASELILSTDDGELIIEFGDGVELNAPIRVDAGSAGIVNFLGSANVNQGIGTELNPVVKVEFVGSDNKPNIDFNDNISIFAQEIFMNKSKYVLHSELVTISTLANATTHLNNPTFNLNNNTLKFSGPVVHDDINGTIEINTTYYSAENNGHIEMTNIGDSINLTNSKSLIINVYDGFMLPLPQAGEVRTFDLFVENGGTLTLNEEGNVVNAYNYDGDPNPFVEWSFNHETGVLTQTLIKNPDEVLDKVVNNPVQSQNIQNLSVETKQDILNIAANEGGAAANEALERFSNSDAVAIASAPTNLAVQDATQTVSNRASNISQPLQFIAPSTSEVTTNSLANTSGVSSGDEVYKYGAWISPFYGVNTQKSRAGQPGYKSSYYGGVLGVDSLIDDKTALGIAFSYIKTDIKHKDQNNGDKTKVNTFVLSGYGTYELSKEWFIQGVASVARSRVKNRELRREFGATRIAAADYNLTSWGAEILAGYNHKLTSNILLTPLFGFEYNRANKFSYRESGTNLQNLAIKGKAKNQLEAIVGAKIASVYDLEVKKEALTLLPEVHGNIRYGIIDPKLNIDIRQDGVNGALLVPRTAKQVRTVFNIGGSVTAKQNEKWEYLIGYDLRLADKYAAHQGTLKIRLNF